MATCSSVLRFLSPPSPPLLDSSLPLLSSSLLSSPSLLSLSGGKQGKEWSANAWDEGTGGVRDERRDVFRVHLPTEGGGEGEEEERICVSGERKEVAGIKEEVSSQSDVRNELQGVEEREEMQRATDRREENNPILKTQTNFKVYFASAKTAQRS